MHRPFFPMLNTFLLGFFNIGYYRLVIVFIGYDLPKNKDTFQPTVTSQVLTEKLLMG